jgi:hypothetical protein
MKHFDLRQVKGGWNQNVHPNLRQVNGQAGSLNSKGL